MEKIQAFPWPYWESEMPLAKSIGLSKMEWTLDQEKIFVNPLMTKQGQATIQRLAAINAIQILSLTGDCFMHAPFWKAKGSMREHLIQTFFEVLLASAKMGIKYVVVPLVDKGALATSQQRILLENTLLNFRNFLFQHNMAIAFESDFPPHKLKQFIDGFPSELFGINFDMGNSASLGFDPEEEISLLSNRIINVHVKDRLLGGMTVPLGKGAVNFKKVFSLFQKVNYSGNFILQTARAKDENDVEILSQYIDFTLRHMGNAYGSSIKR